MKTDQAHFAEEISTSGVIYIQYFPSVINRDSFLLLLNLLFYYYRFLQLINVEKKF